VTNEKGKSSILLLRWEKICSEKISRNLPVSNLKNFIFLLLPVRLPVTKNKKKHDEKTQLETSCVKIGAENVFLKGVP